MSDAWQEIQALKSKRNIYREKLEKRKKQLQDILGTSLGVPIKSEGSPISIKQERSVSSPSSIKNENSDSQPGQTDESGETEKELLRVLSALTLPLPAECKDLTTLVGKDANPNVVASLLHKFAAQLLIVVSETSKEEGQPTQLEVQSIEHVKLAAMVNEMGMDAVHERADTKFSDDHSNARKRKGDEDTTEDPGGKTLKPGTDKDDKKSIKKGEPDILSLLSMPSSREKESKKMGEEILDLLSKPTAKERSLAEKFKSQGGAQVMEFCPHGTRAECLRNNNSHKQHQQGYSPDQVTVTGTPEPSGDLSGQPCRKLHFKKIIQMHTDETLGDCSFLNTCFHMDSCKYVHYKVDGAVHQSKDLEGNTSIGSAGNSARTSTGTSQALTSLPGTPNGSGSHRASCSSTVSRTPTTTADAVAGDPTTLYPPQWVQCDLRFLDMTVLGKFAVIMADPPWDIHMELPYGTMSDDEMRQLGIPQLQDQGLIFLWVTGRAMELGRECLKLWGYERVDEIIWVKTNQLQRIIRTGRTGHWLNHGKEHCLVGMKGRPPNLNCGLDCDVIVAEVRATSHKPDEIYGMIERLSPGTRKIELFGRPHNVQPNWITLGNQVDGVRLVDPELIQAFQQRYPDGNCMTPKADVS